MGNDKSKLGVRTIAPEPEVAQWVTQVRPAVHSIEVKPRQVFSTRWHSQDEKAWREQFLPVWKALPDTFVVAGLTTPTAWSWHGDQTRGGREYAKQLLHVHEYLDGRVNAWWGLHGKESYIEATAEYGAMAAFNEFCASVIDELQANGVSFATGPFKPRERNAKYATPDFHTDVVAQANYVAWDAADVPFGTSVIEDNTQMRFAFGTASRKPVVVTNFGLAPWWDVYEKDGDWVWLRYATSGTLGAWPLPRATGRVDSQGYIELIRACDDWLLGQRDVIAAALNCYGRQGWLISPKLHDWLAQY